MPTARIKLQNTHQVAPGTMAFYFDKPTGFEYKAGQLGEFTLVDPPESDGEGTTRPFTLASAPFEQHLMVATRMRDSAFKRVLKNLSPGDELDIDAPHGSFTLHNNQNVPAVFLTGGIGITPVRSILLQAARDQRPHAITAFISNRTPEQAAFVEELTDATRHHANHTLVPTMTQMDQSNQSWSGETGHVTIEMLGRYVSDLTAPIYYLTGPRGLVEAMQSLLNDAGVDEDNIRAEEFSGY